MFSFQSSRYKNVFMATHPQNFDIVEMKRLKHDNEKYRNDRGHKLIFFIFYEKDHDLPF